MFDVDWGELFAMNVSFLELVVRGSAMYWFLFVIFRFVIRRDVGSVGVADILILVIVADASQNAMAGEYQTISEGMVLVGTLIFWNVALDWVCFHVPAIRRFAEASSLLLVKDGQLLKRNMRKEFLTEEELWVQLRGHEVTSLDEVARVYLEPNGEFSVIKRKGKGD